MDYSTLLKIKNKLNKNKKQTQLIHIHYSNPVYSRQCYFVIIHIILQYALIFWSSYLIEFFQYFLYFISVLGKEQERTFPRKSTIS